MAKKESKGTGNLVGKKLGDYQLVSKLATGGMAHIYKGIDDRLQRQAAVKVLTPDMMEADESLTERFQREARAIAALDHENIIPIYQYGEQDDMYFLVMKYVQGMDLADELNRLRRAGDKMEIKRTLNILEQVASALDYAHSKGIIHRDVKPSNILLDPKDKAFLTDFGLVLRQSVDQTLGTAFGTPRYISPEQAIASEDAVPQSDIYSLAVVLFEILTGQSLFKGSTPMEMALSHVNQPPPAPRSINPDIPHAVEAEILRALSKEPKLRQSTATAFIHSVKRGYGIDSDAADSDNPPTKPVGSVTPPEIPESKTPIFIDFSKPKIEDPIVPSPIGTAPTAHRKKRRWPVILAILWLIIVTVGVYLLANSDVGKNFLAGLNSPVATQTAGVNNGTQSPTNPTAQSVGDVTPDGGNRAIVLNYTDEIFTMRNQNSLPMDITGLKFVRGEDEGTDDLYGSSVPGGRLASDRCLMVKRQNRDIEPPTEWGCRNKIGYSGIRAPQNLFWRNEGSGASYDTFRVLYNEEVVATCNTVARGASGTCEFNWDAISG